MDTITRRQALGRTATHAARVAALLSLAGLWPLAARAAGAFDARSLPDAIKALGAGAPVESREVRLEAPDISENGAQVQVTLSSTAPAVRRLVLLVEKNPNLLSAVFELSDAVEPTVTTRVKMAQSSNVYAVALLADGRALFTVKDVKVTLGGCAV
jgi:sulfur-oxidizing protein SoxY